MTPQPKFKIVERVYLKEDCGKLLSKEAIMLDLSVIQYEVYDYEYKNNIDSWVYRLPKHTTLLDGEYAWFVLCEDQLCTLPELIALAKERAERFLKMIEECGGVEHCLDPVEIKEWKCVSTQH